MKRHLAGPAVLIVLLAACTDERMIRVQEPWPTDPAALDVFVGTWSVEGDMKAGNAYGAPAGRYTYTEEYDWRPGDFLLEMTRTGRGPAGEMRQNFTLGYQVTTRQYSMIGMDLVTGAVASGSGTNQGDTWLFVSTAHLGGGRYAHERCTLRVASEEAYTVQCETSPDARTWSASYEARATRS